MFPRHPCGWSRPPAPAAPGSDPRLPPPPLSVQPDRPGPRKVQPAIQSAPGIEGPVHGAASAGRVDHEGRPHIAHPGIVVADLEHAYPWIELRAREFVLPGADAHGHRFEPGDGRGDGGKSPLRRPRARAPVVHALGPQHPAAGVAIELGGHPVAIGPGLWAVSVRVMAGSLGKPRNAGERLETGRCRRPERRAANCAAWSRRQPAGLPGSSCPGESAAYPTAASRRAAGCTPVQPPAGSGPPICRALRAR